MRCGAGWKPAGTCSPTARADTVSWGYTPIAPYHVAFTPTIRALDINVGGEAVLADGRATRVDGDEIRAKAREQAQRLFAALDELD